MAGNRLLSFLVLSPLVLLAGAALAGPLPVDQVPLPLRPWVDWALYGHETERCPQLPDEGEARCIWAGKLDLALEPTGGKFQQTWEIQVEGAVPLPGDRDRWPVAVLAGGRPAAVLEQEGRPFVRLAPGRHALSGSFVWKRLPGSLPVPAATGLVGLRLGGQVVEFPRLEGGELFLSATTRPETAADRLDITVHRMVVDDVPLRLTTRLQLAVAGKMREVVLGQALPAGFSPHALHGDLPTRLEPGGRLRVQLRPGTFTVTLEARQPAPAVALTRPAPEGLWAEGDEVWVFQAQPALRVVTVSGAPAVDPRQATLPDDWRTLPAFLMKPGATLRLTERRRGDADPAPDQLRLARELWLDFDGGGYTARDTITGQLARSWRLQVGEGALLGRAAVGGVDQFVTRLPGGSGAGLEIRQGQVSLQAESRLEGARRRISAVGWAHDFQAVSATLNLPPGWRLVHASGADRVDTTWIKRWTLLDLFLVLLVAISVTRLFGRGPGLLALAMLVLVVQERDAPAWIWLAVVLGEALVRALPAGQLRKVAKLYRLAAALVLLMLAVPFSIEQVRGAIYPALAPSAGGFAGPGDLHELDLVSAKSQSVPSAPAPAAAPPPEREQMKEDRVGQLGRRAARSPLPRAESLAAATSSRDQQRLTGYDPDAQVQTGPGVPRWQWTRVGLTWNGPVERDAVLTLWLEPPWLASLLALAGVALVVLLALVLFRSALANPGASFGRWLPAVPALLLVVALPRTAPAAEVPTGEMLDQLRARLLARPDCHPRCVALGRLVLEAAPQRLRLRLEASAAVPAPVPLPGLAEHWLPASVLVDGQPASALLRQDGRLWLRLTPGNHQVVLEGPVAGRQTVQLSFGPVRPHAVAATLNGWSLAGVAEDGAVGDALQLTRAETAAARAAGTAEAFAAQSLPPFVTVERNLQLGLDWEVETRVVRATPGSVVLEVPLLPGESVVSDGVRVSGGKVQVNMGPDQHQTGWRSVLAQKSPIALTAAAGGAWAEQWRLDVGPIWHATVSGIPPVHPGEAGAARLRSWRPWPGESVSIAVTRPPGVAGRTFTIDQSALQLRPGSRSTEATLTLQVRSSRGGEQVLTLPGGATLESLQLDGRDQPLRQEGARVTLALTPGAQSFRLAFRSDPPLRFFYRTPRVDLGVPSVNADLRLGLGGDRWILLLGGPRLGPAVLVWSVLVVIVIAGLLLGRTSLTPLRPRHWILLGLGFVPLSVGAAAVVAGYLLALGWRRDRFRARSPWLHNLVLVALGLWTIAAAGVLFVVVQQGLLASPDMQIAGNGSSPGQLAWYSDRAPGPLPTAWAVSLPLFAYHLAMLAWALWLASALIRWSRWVWSCFAEGGLWRPVRQQPAPPP
jgi:hypothetical protein